MRDIRFTAGFSRINRWLNIRLPAYRTGQITNSSHVVLLFLFYGTFVVSFLLFCALLASYALLGHHYVSGRMSVAFASLTAMVLAYLFIRRRQFQYAAYILVAFYGAVATGMAWRWGINLPSGLLFGSLTVILAGMLLGPVKTLYTAALLTTALAILQLGLQRNWYHPDLTWTSRSSNYGDVAGYAIIYAMFALVSWLFGKEILRSLERAEAAEATILQEKDLLEQRVGERTAKLQVMQLEKIQQLQRFAELGQLSTAMMHELANHLTTLSLNIESLHGEQRNDALTHARHSLRYIEKMTKDVSKRLQGLPVQQSFDVAEQTKSVLQELTVKANEASVKLRYDAPSPNFALRCFGDAVQFKHIISVLITNAIEAYEEEPAEHREVLVAFSSDNKRASVHVIDYGEGIAASQLPFLFEPFHSTKKQGSGVGLYIAKTIAHSHFKGDIHLKSSVAGQTEFILSLPLQKP